MTQRVLVLRHGRSVANEEGVIASQPANAGEAYGLTPLGRAQVRRSVVRAVARGALAPPLWLVTSPLLRARESAAVAAQVLGVTPSVDARLTERDFGELELGPDARYGDVWAEDRSDPGHHRWGVESVAEVLARAGALVQELMHDGHAATLVLCTHGDVASTLLCAGRGAPLDRHREVGAVPTGGLRALRSADALLDAWRALATAAEGREGSRS